MGIHLKVGVSLGGAVFTPANYIVTNDAEFVTAHTAATSGQIIQLSAAGAFGDLTVTKSGITVRGESASAGNLNRVIVTGAQNVTLQRLPIQWTGSGTGPLVSLNGNIDGLVLETSSIRAGYGAPKLDFDTSFTSSATPAYPVGPPGGDATGNGLSGNAAYTASNAASVPVVAQGLPVGFGYGGGTEVTGSYTLRRNTFRDLLHGIRALAGGTGVEIDIYGNDIARVYGVHASITALAGLLSSNRLWIWGNKTDKAFAQAQDNVNPHREAFGVFATAATVPLRGVMIAWNDYYVDNTNRGNGTAGIALLDGASTKYFQAPIVWRNWICDRMEAGMVVDGAVGGLYARNTLLSNTEANAVRTADNEGSANPFSATLIAANSGPLLKSIQMTQVQPAGIVSLARVENNLAEALQLDAYSQQSGNVLAGFKATPVLRYDALLGTPAAGWPTTMSDRDLAAAHLQGTAANGHSGKGALDAAQTLTSLRSVASGDTPPLAEIPCLVLWVDKSEQAVASTVTSDWAPIVKPYGRDVTVTLGGGGEIEIADDAAGTNTTGWTSSPTTTGAGHRWARRRVTSGAASTASNATVTLDGGVATNWSVTTVSSTAFSRVAFTKAEPDIFRTASTNFGLANGQTLTFAVDLLHSATPPASHVQLMGNTAGVTFFLQILTTGFFRLYVQDAAAATNATMTSTASICDGAVKRIRGSIDLSQLSLAAGARLYINGSPALGTSTWNSTAGDKIIPWSTNRQWQVGGNAGAGSAANFEGSLDMFWLFPNVLVDLTSAAERVKFNADLIGAAGAGVTGTAPPVFITGNAAAYNAAGGINLGTGAKFIKVGTAAVTDV